VNEKIEGFFDVCSDRGLTGTQGVIIPAGNAGELMLRPDVVEAGAEGRFHVYAIDTIHQALELLTGREPRTVLKRAEARSRRFWKLTAKAPSPRITLLEE
jgi:predicted ATP-dependent protease